MNRKFATIALTLITLLGLLVLSACSSQPARVRATWINPEVSGDTVLIPLSEVQKETITHSRVSTPAGNITFMAYEYKDDLYVRADICPPCRSENFSLVDDTLVCDSCGTVFKAASGNGVSGGCVRYPKADIPYLLQDGKIVIQEAALVTAFRETLSPN